MADLAYVPFLDLEPCVGRWCRMPAEEAERRRLRHFDRNGYLALKARYEEGCFRFLEVEWLPEGKVNG